MEGIPMRHLREEDEYDRLEQYERLVDLFDEEPWAAEEDEDEEEEEDDEDEGE